MLIETVTAKNLEQVLPLIADYQRFYEMEPDTARNREFFGALGESSRLGMQFLASDSELDEAIGFATLYFLPSSLSGRTMCVLNDLFTVPSYRGRGVARALIARVSEVARGRGFHEIEWQTARSNTTAQKLYDGIGARRTEWYTYSLTV